MNYAYSRIRYARSLTSPWARPALPRLSTRREQLREPNLLMDSGVPVFIPSRASVRRAHRATVAKKVECQHGDADERRRRAIRLGIVLRVRANADVFVQNLEVGAAARAGLGSDDLRERFPQLITCDISGYGETGPLRRHEGPRPARAGRSGAGSGERHAGALRAGRHLGGRHLDGALRRARH